MMLLQLKYFPLAGILFFRKLMSGGVLISVPHCVLNFTVNTNSYSPYIDRIFSKVQRGNDVTTTATRSYIMSFSVA